MKKHKIELSVILSLTIVLTLLVFSIGATIGDINSSSSASATNAYEKYRTASISLLEGQDIEQTLYGDGEEQVINAISAGGRLYLFINTTSTTLDFSQGAGAYVCVLDSLLSTVAFHYLGQEKLLSASVGEGGFILAFDGEAGIRLALYGYDCAALLQSESFSGQFCSLLLSDDGYLLITANSASAISQSYLCAHKLDFSLKSTFSHSLYSSRDMNFICAFEKGENYVIFFNAQNDLGIRLGACIVGKASTITYLLKEGNYHTSAVLPLDEGFVALATAKQNAYILQIDSKYNSDFVNTFIGEFTSATLSFGCGIYYAHFEGDSPIALAFENLASLTPFEGFNNISHIHSTLNGKDYTLFCANSERGDVVFSNKFFCFLDGSDSILTSLDGQIFAVTKTKKDAPHVRISRLDV